MLARNQKNEVENLESGAVMTAKIIHGERVGRLGRLTVGCSAGIFDPSKQMILLIRRADNGRWGVPGGYMEAGESVTEGCAREVLEETGLHVQVKRLIGVYTSPHILVEYPDGNRWQFVALYFAAEPIGGDIKAGDDATEAGYFSHAETENMDIGSFDRQLIADAFATQEAAFIRDDIRIDPR